MSTVVLDVFYVLPSGLPQNKPKTMEFETKDKATLLDYLKQPLFISHVAWFSIVQLRFLYFIGNLNPLLNHRLDHDVAQGNTQTKYIQKSITIFLNCFKISNVTDINGLHNVTNHLVLKLLEYDHLIYVRICCSYNWCIGCFIYSCASFDRLYHTYTCRHIYFSFSE